MEETRTNTATPLQGDRTRAVAEATQQVSTLALKFSSL